ncbi:MAG: hypothetical protein LBF39_02180 [Prevotellaceae bacterium]|jgi:hypothetical protein|nr:hypothetical protein [Prevotellaceae bacterium]
MRQVNYLLVGIVIERASCMFAAACFAGNGAEKQMNNEISEKGERF